VCGTASHSPRVVYRMSTQVSAHICIREVRFEETALIVLLEASTCLAIKSRTCEWKVLVIRNTAKQATFKVFYEDNESSVTVIIK